MLSHYYYLPIYDRYGVHMTHELMATIGSQMTNVPFLLTAINTTIKERVLSDATRKGSTLSSIDLSKVSHVDSEPFVSPGMMYGHWC
jgi:hypothetical protein